MYYFPSVRFFFSRRTLVSIFNVCSCGFALFKSSPKAISSGLALDYTTTPHDCKVFFSYYFCSKPSFFIYCPTFTPNCTDSALDGANQCGTLSIIYVSFIFCSISSTRFIHIKFIFCLIIVKTFSLRIFFRNRFPFLTGIPAAPSLRKAG